MKIRVTFLTLLLALFGAELMFAQAHFDTSLHKTRQGKFTAYAAENGGMELITNIHSHAGSILLEMPLGNRQGRGRK